MKKNIFLPGVLSVFFMQSVFADDGTYMDANEIFSDQNFRISTLSSNEMQHTKGAFLGMASFSSILNNQITPATAISSGLFGTSIALSNSVAVNTAINAPITINVGRWFSFSH